MRKNCGTLPPSRPLTDARPPALAVTVIIPVWGDYVDACLDDALDSIRAQNVPATIVLVDNADDPPLERPGVTVVRSELRLSVGAARDLGLRSVTTPLVMFWDADDVMFPQTLDRLQQVMTARPEVVACSTSFIDGRSLLPHHWPRRLPLRLARCINAFAVLNAVSSLYASTGALIRTSAAQDAGFPDADTGDDWAFGVSLAFRGQIVVDPHRGRLYRRDPDSLSARWTRHHVLAAADLVRQRIREDAAVPPGARLLLPLICTGQQVVLRVLRPIARRTPHRRRSGT